MSSYSRKYAYETFGYNMFKTFKEVQRTLRYSLPHKDDVDFDNFRVITSKCLLVKPKICSPLNTDPYMVKIISRVSSENSRKELFSVYTQARKELRESQTDMYPYYDRDAKSMMQTMDSVPERNYNQSTFPSNHFNR